MKCKQIQVENFNKMPVVSNRVLKQVSKQITKRGSKTCQKLVLMLAIEYNSNRSNTDGGYLMQTQNNEAGGDYAVDTRHNKDKVLKEGLSLFKNSSLAFLDSSLTGVVTDILSTEITETTTKKAYADNALKLSTNQGIHHEWEVDISNDDMKRFASYHIDLSRMHNLIFTTVVITAKKPDVTQYVSPSMIFTPKIINLADRDADAALEKIEAKLKAGEPVNELELIYLPMYTAKSGKSTADLLDIAIKLVPRAAQGDKHKKKKLHSLLILLTGTFITDDELNTILEANMRILDDHPAVRVLEARGHRKAMERVAVSMLEEGDDYPKVSRVTGLDVDRIATLDKERRQQMQTAVI